MQPKVPKHLDARDAPARDEFIEETKSIFALLTRPVIESRNPKTPGKEFVSNYSRMVDTIVGMLFQRATQDHAISAERAGVAVIAMGGYGRAELAPYSDVDVLVLCKERTREVEAMAGSFIRYLWDVGFELGHTVESLVESETVLGQDMDTKTALIESRWVCGSKRVARAVERQISRIRRREREEYLKRKIRDALARHERHGHSFQLVEPNVKSSPGGMRDFQTLVWLGQVGHATRGLKALRNKGLLIRGEETELEEAYDYLLRVRVELHLQTTSKQDQLTVAMQRKLSRTLGYRGRGGQLDVEFFMRDYYRHTRAVYRITADILKDLHHGRDVGALVGRRAIRPVDTMTARIHRGKIVREPLYIFERQKRLGTPLDRGLRRRLEVILGRDLRGRVAANRMRRSFARMLEDDSNLDLVIRSLHETRFLDRIIPEYRSLTCLKRYDLYHHYTVDEHSFQVLENLIELGHGEADPTDPMVRLYTELDDKRTLFFAALLHDVGKIEGRGHAKKGAALSRKILARLFIPEAEIDRVSFLIEHHLLMSQFSQRRDPTDLDTLAAFCKLVKTRVNLKYLCLLTYADYKATSPVVWNEWKQTLLWELYLRAYEYLEKKEKRPDAFYKRHKSKLLASFPPGKVRDSVLEHLDLLPGGYLLTMNARAVEKHMEMIATLERNPAAVWYEQRKSTHRFTFCTRDKPYRLSQLCGVLTINDFNILHAYAFTRKDGKVIDVFDVDDLVARGRDDVGERVEAIERVLRGVVAGRVDLEAETARHASRWRRTRRATIPVAPNVEFENDLSGDFTIIDIFAPDAPGLLFRLTRALSREKLTIYRANISTEADRAIDSFYVADVYGNKIKAAGRLGRIREALRNVIGKGAG